ncbi:putative lipid scramblase CLPTM1 [Lineus longissimus]|uniref:putative lipid scramblase CLPTM1 n=1 Tax=Lineus longissimus TaxID=88925 RepID=UPI00315D1E19
MVKGFLVRAVIIYFISSLFRGKSTPPAATPGDPSAVAKNSIPSTNMFPKEMLMDLHVFLSEQEEFTDFNNPEAKFWFKQGLVYGDWTSGPDGDGSHKKFKSMATPLAVQNNGSIYLHLYLTKMGRSPDPKDKTYLKRMMVYKKRQLNKYKKKKYHTMVNLLTGKTEAHPDMIKKDNDTNEIKVLSHWHPNLTVCLLDDHTPWVKGSVPQPLDEHIDFEPGTQQYKPVIYFNDYWNMNSDYMPINETVHELNFTLTFTPISLFKWQMYAAQGMRSKWYSVLGDDFMPEESDEDQDSLKRTLVETNPYLLGLTIVVSIVHSVFEFLAFKNDIQFWKSRKSLEGLSVRSVFFNVFQSLIVVLYVLDNETNTVVRISVIIGLAIECWKIKKVVDVKLDFEQRWFGIIPRLYFADKSTYLQSNTKVYDQNAFKYLSWLLFPLLVCYSIYSLFYVEHKGYYSWVLSLLYGFLLTFGFIMMTPQLFINYKMKSVAHLPWRMLTYKALNTFIDDIFAFVIKMPTLYRIGCLRDDVIFFIYLYQKWIYPIDPKRVNEYGTSLEMMDENGKIITPPEEGGGDPAAIGEGEATEGEVTEAKPAGEKKND